MKFDTFDSVVSFYNATKPVVSVNHKKEDDVRPISERRYTWRRIKKYDDNCYALLDGDYSARNTSDEYERAMAPITWTRDPESGDTFIRVRNGVSPYPHHGRYRFLQWHLPQTMHFTIDQSGIQKIKVCTDNVLRDTYKFRSWDEFVLPKTNYAWSHNDKRPNGAEDNVFLTFKCNEDGTFERWGDKIIVRTRNIDMDLKREWKPRLQAFYMFMASIVPMLDFTWATHNEYMNQIDEWKKDNGGGRTFGTAWGRTTLFGMPKDVAREIVTNTEHPLRVAVAALIARETEGHREIKSEEQLREVRRKYNYVMNRFLQMQETKEV
jgi:hypothetical protein